MPTRFLGLDISSRRYGWGTFDGVDMKSGSAQCPVPRPEGAGNKLHAGFAGAVLDWQTLRLRHLFEVSEPDLIGIEEPLNSNAAPKDDEGRSKTTSATLHLLAAVAANAARIAVSMAIPVEYVNQSEWRAAFGVRSLTKADRRTLTGTSTEWLKNESMRLARLHGGKPANGDEGDACGVAYCMWARARRAKLDLFAAAGA